MVVESTAEPARALFKTALPHRGRLVINQFTSVLYEFDALPLMGQILERQMGHCVFGTDSIIAKLYME